MKLGRAALAGAIETLRGIRTSLNTSNAAPARQQALGSILEYCRDTSGMLSTV